MQVSKENKNNHIEVDFKNEERVVFNSFIAIFQNKQKLLQ